MEPWNNITVLVVKRVRGVRHLSTKTERGAGKERTNSHSEDYRFIIYNNCRE